MPNETVRTINENDFYAHPIFDPLKFRIKTPAIEVLTENLTRLVWTGATGASLLGFTRAGKTVALEMIAQDIVSRAGNAIPVLQYAVHRRDQGRIRSLLVNMFENFQLAYTKRQAAEALTANLLMYFSETAMQYHSHQIILSIDEAQRLQIPQIDLFAELDDRLRKEYGISLLCLFVGNQEQMGRLLTDVHKGENEHIEGRFFRQTLRFGGLRTANDVKFCLKQYDTLRYPDEGPTYTEYFLPTEFREGFRLSALTDSMWSEFRECKKIAGITDWGMEYFVRAVNTLLIDYLPKFGVGSYSSEMFRNCLDVSGIYPDNDVAEWKHG